jgi:hypothetical protein
VIISIGNKQDLRLSSQKRRSSRSAAAKAAAEMATVIVTSFAFNPCIKEDCTEA